MLRSIFKVICLTFISMGAAHSAKQTLDVQGHRGARSVLPENSLAGFKYAMEIGVDTLELDLGVTRDDVVVVVHDQIINSELCQYKDGRPIKGSLLVHSLSFKQIKQFDCGNKAILGFPTQSRLPGSEIPSLAEVFEMVVGSNLENANTIRFNVETKSNPAYPYAQPTADKFVALVVAEIDRFKLRSRVNLQSFDPRTLLACHALAPDIELAILLRDKPKDWLAIAKTYHANIVSPYFKSINEEDVRLMQNAGLKVVPWTVNSEDEWMRLIEFGVDGIITDNPRPLLKILGRG